MTDFFANLGTIVFDAAPGAISPMPINCDSFDDQDIEAALNYVNNILTDVLHMSRLPNDPKTGFPAFDIYDANDKWVAGG